MEKWLKIEEKNYFFLRTSWIIERNSFHFLKFNIRNIAILIEKTNRISESAFIFPENPKIAGECEL